MQNILYICESCKIVTICSRQRKTLSSSKGLFLFPVLGRVSAVCTHKKLNRTGHVIAFVAHVEEFGNHIRAVIKRKRLA